MMGGVRDPADHHPCTCPRGLEEVDLLFPPVRLLRCEDPGSVFGIRAVLLNKGKPCFFFRRLLGPDIYAEESAEPEIFAQTLMDHLLSDVAASPILGVWTCIHVLVP